MTFRLRYDFSMRRWLVVTLVLVGVAVAPAASAQINGTRASVTSLGGSPFFPPGPRASVTSLGPLGFTPNNIFPSCCFNFPVGRHHHHGFVGAGFGVGVLPLYSMPYYYPGYGDMVNPVDDTMEQAYGPTYGPGSDRQRSSGAQQLDDRLSRLEQQLDDIENTSPKSQPAGSEPQVPLADQPDTILVFRDGHSIDVKNYAIVGDTLYDFSNGTRHKIALGDLDLSATQKQNDERGLDFRLPMRPLGY